LRGGRAREHLLAGSSALLVSANEELERLPVEGRERRELDHVESALA
jgi:hypothetical protein